MVARIDRRARRVSVCAALAAALLGGAAGQARASSIAFLREGNIWIANVDGSGTRQLTTDGGTDGSVSYAYVSASKVASRPLLGYRHVNAVGVINPDGSGKQDIQQPRPAAVGPDAVLDPSGQRLAYIWTYFISGFQGFDGATIGVDGTNGTHLGRSSVVDVSFGDATGQSVLWAGFVHNAYGTASGPDCSANQTEPFGLALQVPDRDNTPDDNQGAGYFCVTGQNVVEPKVSADGQRVLATLQGTDGSSRIIAFPRSEMTSPFDPAGASFTYLTPSNLIASHGEFSPDGTQIAFQGPGNTIWTVPADGSAASTKILDDAEIPAWSVYTIPGPSPIAQSLTITHPSRIKLSKLISRGVGVGITTTVPVAAGVELAINAATARRLGFGHRQVNLGQKTGAVSSSRTFTVKPNSKYKRKLAKARSFTVYVIVVVADSHGNRGTKVYKVTVSR